MRMVKKFNLGEKIIHLRTLTQDELSSLINVFIHNKRDPKQKLQALAIVEWIKDRGGWLECTCDVDIKPLMTVGLSQKGNFYIQRINARGLHHERCPFKGIEQPAIAHSHAIKRCNKNLPLRLHRRGALDNARSIDPQSPHKKNSVAARYPRLARVLFTWIEQASLNTLNASAQEGLAAQYKRLKTVAEDYQFEKGINAAKFLWTYPDVNQMINRLQHTQHQWPDKSRPHAVCIAVADSIEDKRLFFSLKERQITVELSGDVRPSSGRIGVNSGPFLVIFTVTDTIDAPGMYQPLNAFYVPVYSKYQLIPVDSSFERKVLMTIEQRARWWRGDHKLTVSIKKPLFDIHVKVNDEIKASKPDFLIETPGARIIFEVMGSEEKDYLDRKLRTVDAMQAMGDVIEFNAIHAYKTGHWDEHLKKSISQLSAMVFKGNAK